MSIVLFRTAQMKPEQTGNKNGQVDLSQGRFQYGQTPHTPGYGHDISVTECRQKGELVVDKFFHAPFDEAGRAVL